MKINKKQEQLGMNPSTAQAKLLRDILWSLVVETNKHYCCKCHKEMSRETFSIEHVTPWLDSDNPLELFFDLNNISFSHFSCNISTARRVNRKYHTQEERDDRNKEIWRETKKRNYSSEKRREKYRTKGY